MTILYNGDIDCKVAIFVAKREGYIPISTSFWETSWRTEYFELGMERFHNKNKSGLIFLDCLPDDRIIKILYNAQIPVFVILKNAYYKDKFEEYFQNGWVKGFYFSELSITYMLLSWFRYKRDDERTIRFLEQLKTSKAIQMDNFEYSLNLLNSYVTGNDIFPDAFAYGHLLETVQGKTQIPKQYEKHLFNMVQVTKDITEGLQIVETKKKLFLDFFKKNGYYIKYSKVTLYAVNYPCVENYMIKELIEDNDAILTYYNDGYYWHCKLFSNRSSINCIKLAKRYHENTKQRFFGNEREAEFMLYNLPIWIRDGKLEIRYKGKKI